MLQVDKCVIPLPVTWCTNTDYAIAYVWSYRQRRPRPTSPTFMKCRLNADVFPDRLILVISYYCQMKKQGVHEKIVVVVFFTIGTSWRPRSDVRSLTIGVVFFLFEVYNKLATGA